MLLYQHFNYSLNFSKVKRQKKNFSKKNNRPVPAGDKYGHEHAAALYFRIRDIRQKEPTCPIRVQRRNHLGMPCFLRSEMVSA